MRYSTEYRKNNTLQIQKKTPTFSRANTDSNWRRPIWKNKNKNTRQKRVPTLGQTRRLLDPVMNRHVSQSNSCLAVIYLHRTINSHSATLGPTRQNITRIYEAFCFWRFFLLPPPLNPQFRKFKYFQNLYIFIWYIYI